MDSGKYVLISFYNRQTEENPAWEVYGHIGPGKNEKLESFKYRIQAMNYAHRFCVPVIQGTNEGHIVEMICK